MSTPRITGDDFSWARIWGIPTNGDKEMIDYFTHVAALQVAQKAIANSQLSDPANPKGASEALTAVEAEPGGAILGSLVDHLLQYSQTPTALEIGLLKKSASVFAEGRTILAKLAAVRSSLETSLATPTAPGALAAYNAALAELPAIGTDFQNMAQKFQALQAGFPANWIAPVGQQLNEPVAQWAWRDIFLARRTTAFVATTQELATTARGKAFAFGAFAGAAGNLIGSGYLNSVVGGPRRSHTLRHRLAAYSVGAWMRDNEPQYAETLANIRSALLFGQSGTPTLPSDLKTLAHAALRQSYPSGTPALPNLETGYTNLLEHLSLLGDFSLPAAPVPPNNTVAGNIIASGLTLGTNTVQIQGEVAGATTSFGQNTPLIGHHESAAGVCEQILLWLAIPIFSWIYSIDVACGGGQGASGSPDLTSTGELISLSQSPTGLSGINSLYSLALNAWQALAAGRTVLVLRGLLYPDPDDLSNPTFAQFLSIPTTTTGYPLLEMPASDDGITYPTSGLETPATTSSPYAPGALPQSFLTGSSNASVLALGPTIWEDMILYPRSDRPWSRNHNLDSDRGFGALCWALSSGASITGLPVNITDLAYNAI
jgi:hypothetical protein